MLVANRSVTLRHSLAAPASGLGCSCDSTPGGQGTALAQLWGRRVVLGIWASGSGHDYNLITSASRAQWQLGSQGTRHQGVGTLDCGMVRLGSTPDSGRPGAEVARTPEWWYKVVIWALEG